MLLAFVLLIPSCVKEIITDMPIETGSFPSQKVITSSFYGQLTDMDGSPIANTEVKLLNALQGEISEMSDDFGNFRFLDVRTKGSYGNLNIEAEGMWEVNKTILLVENKTTRVDIVFESNEVLAFHHANP